MKFATKHIGLQYYPSRRRQVATLPREIKNSNFLQIFNTNFNSCTRVTVYAECIYVFSVFEWDRNVYGSLSYLSI